MSKKSWIDDTYIGELIDRTVDGWAKILGFTEEKQKPKKKTTRKMKMTTKGINLFDNLTNYHC